jgi:hypothetical protein
MDPVQQNKSLAKLPYIYHFYLHSLIVYNAISNIHIS